MWGGKEEEEGNGEARGRQRAGGNGWKGGKEDVDGKREKGGISDWIEKNPNEEAAAKQVMGR